MTEQDKLRIKALDNTSDYALWRLTLEAACNAKGLTASFSLKEVPLGADRHKVSEKCI